MRRLSRLASLFSRASLDGLARPAELARSVLRLEKARLDGESLDAYLGRVLSGRRARAVLRLLRWREQRKAKRLAQKRVPALIEPAERMPEAEEIASRLLARAPLLSDRLNLLHDVYTAGGYESAERMLARLLPELGRASPELRARGVPIFSRVLMALGEPRRALSLWQELLPDRALEHPLRQALQLELGELSQPRFLLRGALSAYLADAALRAGQGQQVLASVLDAPWSLLVNPELELLLHNAVRAQQPQALAALNRFLARYRLGRAALVPVSDEPNWLAQLRVSARAGSRGGPLVSVIMSAHDAGATLRYAIDSILAQSYQALELLVADDASSDGSYALLTQRYAGEPRVRLFRSRHNQGTYNVRNQLIAAARGELITFQDADDLALPTRIESQVRALSQGEKVAAISEWLRVRPDGSFAFFPNGRAARLSIVSLMATRAALARVGPYPPARIGADLDIYRRILRSYGGARVVRLPAPLIFGLWSPRSLTRSAAHQSLESGYRSPSRRRYSELVFRQDLFGARILPEELLRAELARSGNFAAESELLSG